MCGPLHLGIFCCQHTHGHAQYLEHIGPHFVEARGRGVACSCACIDSYVLALPVALKCQENACREKQLQLFWEVFPARDGQTTYMFAYTDPTPGVSCSAALGHYVAVQQA